MEREIHYASVSPVFHFQAQISRNLDISMAPQTPGFENTPPLSPPRSLCILSKPVSLAVSHTTVSGTTTYKRRGGVWQVGNMLTGTFRKLGLSFVLCVLYVLFRV